ncbi:rolling circle replication-associated protein [Vibrio viridaestus]|uniref:rolling circle replication-associated protein n=1 Tax=Vibrio viridaestus TaxID=2487322 RepID=UPI001AA05973|nr:hypothetical protein [Vibrio viridaestus]
MINNDIAYIAAVKQPIDKTLSNIAAYDSGFFSGFVNPLEHDHFEKVNQDIRVKTQLFAGVKKSQFDTVRNYETVRAALAEREKGLGSSKGAKVGQEERNPKIDAIFNRARVLNAALRPASVMASREAHLSSDAMYAQQEQSHNNGASRFYLMSREWSGQFKGQLVYKPRPSDAPPSNNGDRYTEKLSTSAVTKIFESGAYVAQCHGGFSTFLTLTFTEAQRNEIFSGNVTLGSEVSRFINAAKKMYRRGWDADYITLRNEESGKAFCPISKDGEKVCGYGNTADFHYVWVAECPANENGEANPHVHMILNWQVEEKLFWAWSQRLENIWGNGFAHIERIKFGKAASGYLIKAVGYAAKGGNADQGLIKGNRYNIARCSRAPKWEALASFDADNMAAIIKECGYKLQQWRKPLEREIRRKKAKRDEFIRLKAIEKKEVSKVARYTNLINKLESEARAVKQEMKSRGVFARSDNSFSITFEGDDAKAKANRFLQWAAGARGWSMNLTGYHFTEEKNGETRDRWAIGGDMSELRDNAVVKYRNEYEQFQYKRADWRSQLTQEHITPTPDYDEIALAVEKCRKHWVEYERLN